MIDVTSIRDRYAAVSPHMDERGRRLFAAGEACSAGYGGIACGSAWKKDPYMGSIFNAD
jgi:hypothetical protein